MTDNCGFSRRGHGGRERERKSGEDGVLEKKRGGRDGGGGGGGGGGYGKWVNREGGGGSSVSNARKQNKFPP